jgi:cell division protein FtsW
MELYKTKEKSKYNIGLMIVAAILLVFGLLMIYSSSSSLALAYQDGDVFYFVKRQIIWIAIGSLLAYYFFRLNYEGIKKLGFFITLGSLILIIYTLPKALFQIDVPFVNTLNGATRWIDLGLFDLQPSELFKFGIIIFTASWLTMSQSSIKSIEQFIRRYRDREYTYKLLNFVYLLFPVVLVILGSLLILLQKDFDTIVIVYVGFVAAYYIGVDKKYQKTAIVVVSMLGIFGSLFALVGVEYRRDRVDAYVEILLQGEPSNDSKKDEAFQVWNGLVGIGSGGLFGLGYGESRQKLFFLQEAAYTDSIYAIIGEEFGLMGSLGIIFLFLLFLSQGLNIAKDSTDKFENIMATGVTVGIASQAFLNIAANLAVIPFGGIPLPFVSYGGTSTVITLISLGLLLKVGAKQSTQIKKFRY